MFVKNLASLCSTVTELFDFLSGHTRGVHFVQYLIAFCSRPEADTDVMSGSCVRLTVPDKDVKFGNPRFIHSR